MLFLFYMEIVILFILSFFLGLMVIDMLKPVFQQQTLTEIFRDNMITGLKSHLFLSIAFGLVVTYLLCLVPVQIISRKSIQVVFMGLSEKISKQRGRTIMLFIQMFVLLMFISGTLIIQLQVKKVKETIWHTLSVEEQKNIFTFSYDDKMTPALLDPILQKLKKSSNAISDVFISRTSLCFDGIRSSKTIGKHENIGVFEYRVSANFADFFNVRLVKGRIFDENDAPDAIVVDETIATLLPDNNPIGQIMNGLTIIGVVENINTVKLEQGQTKRPTFYSRVDRINSGEIYVKAATNKRKEAQKIIKQVQQAFYPDFAQVFADFHATIHTESFLMENLISQFSGICSAISLILCLFGIYSTITMDTEKRRKEVAIRKINGAEIKDIILLFSKTYILLWSLVCLLLFPFIYFAGNLWLETFNQRISLNLFFFSGIYISILAMIFLMILFRIFEVARCNPAEVIKR